MRGRSSDNLPGRGCAPCGVCRRGSCCGPRLRRATVVAISFAAGDLRRAGGAGSNHSSISADLVKVMDHTAFPCASDEICSATPTNPPTCRAPAPGEDVASQRKEQAFALITIAEGQKATLRVPAGSGFLRLELGKCHVVTVGEKMIKFKNPDTAVAKINLGKDLTEEYQVVLGRAGGKISFVLHSGANAVPELGYTVGPDDCEEKAGLMIKGPKNVGDVTATVDAVSSTGEASPESEEL